MNAHLLCIKPVVKLGTKCLKESNWLPNHINLLDKSHINVLVHPSIKCNNNNNNKDHIYADKLFQQNEFAASNQGPVRLGFLFVLFMKMMWPSG